MKSFNLNGNNYPPESKHFANNENIEKRMYDQSGIENITQVPVLNLLASLVKSL